MNHKLFFRLAGVAAILLALVLVTIQAAADVTCKTVSPLSIGGQKSAAIQSTTNCYNLRYIPANQKANYTLSIQLTVNSGRYQLFLAPGSGVTTFKDPDDRLYRFPIEAKHKQFSYNLPPKEYPYGMYTLAVRPMDSGSSSASLKVEMIPVSQPSPPAKPPQSGQTSDIERPATGYFSNTKSVLGSAAGSTAIFPYDIACSGAIRASLTWTGSAKRLFMALGKPVGQEATSVTGASPLGLQYYAANADFVSGNRWQIVVRNLDGGSANLTLRLEDPGNGCVPAALALYRNVTMEIDMDRLGEDYDHITIPASGVSGEEACRAKCRDDARCVAYTYSRGDRVCHLKDGLPPPKANDCCVSGVVAIRYYTLESNVDRLWQDFGQPLPANNVESCQALCAGQMRCQTFTYSISEKLCYLKWGIPAASPDNSCISGTAIYRQATVEYGTDRYSGDYEHRPLPAAKAELCRVACAQDPRCKAYTYADGVCHLKDQVPPKSAKSNCVSGVVQERFLSFEPDVDRPQPNYLRIILPYESPEMCRLMCGQDLRCRAYAYKKPGREGPSSPPLCYLKESVPGIFPDTCCIAGVVK